MAGPAAKREVGGGSHDPPGTHLNASQRPKRRKTMHRSTPDRGKSRKSFNRRAGKTHRLNTAQPLRGGIRL